MNREEFEAQLESDFNDEMEQIAGQPDNPEPTLIDQVLSGDLKLPMACSGGGHHGKQPIPPYQGDPFADDEEEHDNTKYEFVNQPPHYDYFSEQAIDLIEKVLTWEQFIGFLKGTSLRYRIRAGNGKPGNSMEQDLAKARWYEDYYENMIEGNQPS